MSKPAPSFPVETGNHVWKPSNGNYSLKKKTPSGPEHRWFVDISCLERGFLLGLQLTRADFNTHLEKNTRQRRIRG